jgi:hypothetical protein
MTTQGNWSNQTTSQWGLLCALFIYIYRHTRTVVLFYTLGVEWDSTPNEPKHTTRPTRSDPTSTSPVVCIIYLYLYLYIYIYRHTRTVVLFYTQWTQIHTRPTRSDPTSTSQPVNTRPGLVGLPSQPSFLFHASGSRERRGAARPVSASQLGVRPLGEQQRGQGPDAAVCAGVGGGGEWVWGGVEEEAQASHPAAGSGSGSGDMHTASVVPLGNQGWSWSIGAPSPPESVLPRSLLVGDGEHEALVRGRHTLVRVISGGWAAAAHDQQVEWRHGPPSTSGISSSRCKFIWYRALPSAPQKQSIWILMPISNNWDWHRCSHLMIGIAADRIPSRSLIVMSMVTKLPNGYGILADRIYWTGMFT